ncbi:MAG: hypothetical protein PHY44_01690 [Lachnospiraceae bacterium]|nr:hypothetical protein [Lachnospiraceae bacterium]
MQTEKKMMEIQKGSAAQGYAVSIEHILSDIFGCRRFGFGGLVNSDVIRKYPLAAISAGLGYLYANANNKKKAEIEGYIENYKYYLEMSLDELMSFDTSSKCTGKFVQEIDYSNGSEAIKDYIDKLQEIC